jgi:putative DNA primase/helicase
MSGGLPPDSAARFTALTADDLEKLPDGSWLVQNVLPSKGVACIYGASQAGKSALVFHLARSLSTGNSWFGFDVDAKCRVIYVALEGMAGLKARSRALSMADTPGVTHEMRFIIEPFRISDPSNVDALVAEIKRVGGADLVIVDTLNCSAPEAYENSSRDMGLIIAGAKQLQVAIDGLVLLIHHVGKDSSRGLRGHSSLLAALDAALLVARNGEWRSWTLVKSRDSADGANGWFKLDPVVVGEDHKGRQQTAAVVVPSQPPELPAASTALGGNEEVAYEVLSEALGSLVSQTSTDGGDQPVAGLTGKAALDLVKARLEGVEPRRRGERAKSAISTLVKKGLLNLEGGQFRLPGDEAES